MNMSLTSSFLRANIKAETLNTKEALHERVRSGVAQCTEPRSDRYVGIGGVVGNHRFLDERDVELLDAISLTVVCSVYLLKVRSHYPCLGMLDCHFG